MPDSPLPPVPDIVRSAYATLVVTDLAAARRFYVDLLGFVVTAEDPAALYLRGYDELTHHNLILRSGPRAAGGALGYRVRSAADLAKAEAYYAALGCRTRRLPAGTVRGLGEVVRAEDPLGFLIEFFASAAHPERLQQRYDLRRGAEVARLDHFNICVPDVPRAQAHYTGLGFGLSETIEDEQTVYAAWMFRKQTVHDVAFTGGAGPRLHHLGFFAHEPHSVLRICDIVGSLHLEDCIERGPGRHGVSNAFYVYLRDPDGHRLEIYTSDYYTGDPDHPVLRWSVHDPRRRDFWGNAVIPSWYSDASPVLDLDGKVRPVTELAQTAEVSVGADGFTVSTLPADLTAETREIRTQQPCCTGPSHTGGHSDRRERGSPMTDAGAAFQPGTEEITVPFRSRTAYVGFKAFGSGEGAVLVRPEISHQLRTAAEFATQEGRITGGLLYGRFWVDEQGGYLVVDGYLEAGPGENSGDRIGPDGADDFTLGEADLRLLHEDADRMYSGSLEVGWWRTRATLGEFGPQDFETQAELVSPDGAGLLVYGSGLHWGTAYLGPDGLAPDSAGTLAAVADDLAPEPVTESVTEYVPDPGPQVIDIAHGESLLEEPPEETAVLPDPSPAEPWPAEAAPDEGLGLAQPLPPPGDGPAPGSVAVGTPPSRRVRRTRVTSRPRVPSRVRVPRRMRAVREPDPEYSAGPEMPADVILVVGALVIVTVVAAIIIGVLVHSSTVAVIIGIIGLLAIFSTVWMSHR